MNASERNYWYWKILDKSNLNFDKDFFSLDNYDLHYLSCIADAIKCKSENGKSPARTLWDRARKGRPF